VLGMMVPMVVAVSLVTGVLEIVGVARRTMILLAVNSHASQ
jgi:hypothetical protein